MQSSHIFAGSGVLGISAGIMLAALTPATMKPMEQPEWRKNAMVLRQQTESLYAYSMPQDLSPRVGFGNAALHDQYAKMSTEIAWAEPVGRPQPMPDYRPVEVEPVARTGNEATIASLDAVNAGFDEPVVQQAEAEPQLAPAEAKPAAKVAKVVDF